MRGQGQTDGLFQALAGCNSMSHETNALAQIHRQIMWNRLIAVVEEQAQIMIRTAFSTTVREAGDLSAGIFDLQGRMMAQAVTGTPGHVNSMAESVGHFLKKFPAATMRPGDHYITNDPWLGTGHLHDLTVVTPAFHDGKIVGLFANTAHVIDIGGLGMGPEGRSVYEEGMYIPIVKCFDRGQAERDVLRLHARRLAPAGGTGRRHLLAVRLQRRRGQAAGRDDGRVRDDQPGSAGGVHLRQFASRHAGGDRAHSARDLRRRDLFRRLRGTGAAGGVDGRSSDDGIEVDFAGTSGLSSRGINVPPAYCRAYSCFGIKCVVAPEIPNNWASLAPFRMKIPEGCILNAPHPYPVSVRHVIGHLLPDLMMGCLHQAVPERVTAEGASALWNPPLRGGGAISGQARGNKPVMADFEIITFNSGGTGARPTQDGLNATAFPSGVRTMPVEATENVAPIILWRKELKPDSGGAGRTRGGRRPDHGDRHQGRPGIRGERQLRPHRQCAEGPRGRAGRRAPAGSRRRPAGVLRTKGFQVIPDGERLILELPGGAGMGDPADARSGAGGAGRARWSGVGGECTGAVPASSIAADGAVDEAATQALRG